ncbi:hypothetical protein V6N12_036998 [Hibiscus sabdariffa]|uniref:Flowering-promoting factor 1-like protein 2 n=1 Tax=Hibiscus sabdariffa TaxID=183260 RepID=A0ABR2AZ75_9ROSI
MSGVWVFNNGVYRLESSPRRRVLVHLPSAEVVSSYSSLDRILRGLGWERYYGGDPDLYQFHKQSSIDLISLPKDFSKFCSVHMSFFWCLRYPFSFPSPLREVEKNKDWGWIMMGRGRMAQAEGLGRVRHMGCHVKQAGTLHPKPRIAATVPIGQ